MDGHPIDTTDAGGRVRAPRLAPGRHIVSANRLGFANANVSVTVADGDSINLSVEMHVAARTLPGVRANAQPVDPRLEGFMKRMAQGAGYFFTRGKIDSSHTRTLDQLLRAGAPANLIQGPAGLIFLASHGAQLHGQPCWVQIFMDGVLIYNPSLDGSPMGQQDVTNLKGYLNSQLEAVEFYTSPASVPLQ
ncbi:MAG TPA: carboxypeptidase-like regulatory domain-containing protein, partial [Gemmatimonadaceae bacterium]|nr:carboxypeptidase-like regulatory domain-containing protein [Gemmatimonadaceae bacterium]